MFVTNSKCFVLSNQHLRRWSGSSTSSCPHVEASLGKTLNPKLPRLHRCVREWMNEQRKPCKALWIKAPYKAGKSSHSRSENQHCWAFLLKRMTQLLNRLMSHFCSSNSFILCNSYYFSSFWNEPHQHALTRETQDLFYNEIWRLFKH